MENDSVNGANETALLVFSFCVTLVCEQLTFM